MVRDRTASPNCFHCRFSSILLPSTKDLIETFGLSSVQHTIQTLLTCRMLFELRQYGKRTLRGDNFSEYTSGFVVPVDTLVFRQDVAAVGRHMFDIQRMPSHTSIESGSEADNYELELRRYSAGGVFRVSSGL